MQAECRAPGKTKKCGFKNMDLAREVTVGKKPNLVSTGGCRHDRECPDRKVCLGGECVDPCSNIVCRGDHEVCHAFSGHRYQCLCKEGTRRDHLSQECLEEEVAKQEERQGDEAKIQLV